MRKRLAQLGVCAVLAGVAVAAGLGVREFTGGAFAEHAGTILYATLIYLLVYAAVLAWLIVLAILKPTTNAMEPGPVTLGGVALAACAVVELYQLTGVPAQLAANNGLSRLVLGTTFHPADLLWYGVGAAATAGLHRTILRRLGSPAGARRWPALIALLAIVVAVLWLGYHVTAAYEVRPDLGWRPPQDTACRQCANVTAVVTRRANGAPVADAHVTALPPSVPFVGDTPPAPSDGRAVLTAFVDGADRDCVPAGSITLQVTANRFQIATVTAQVPDQAAIDVPILMECTMVTGRVIDSAGSPMAGEWVYLTDRLGNPLLDLEGNPYQARTDLTGRFQFACVPHGEVKVSTDRDPSADQTVPIGPAGGHVELVVQLTAATVIVRVLDADNNDQPLNGAGVRLTTSDGVARTGTTSGTPPQATFPLVLPAGAATVRATMIGYLPNTVNAVIPASGTLTVIIRLRRDVAVQTPTAFVMQLDWGVSPRDLDLHCSGPDGAGGRFHCLFNAMQPVPFVRLDVDDQNATGPERIFVSPVAGAFVPGDYHCWVDNFSGEQPFNNSGASVTLLSLDAASIPTQRGRWVAADVPGNPDRLWYVTRFTIDPQGQLTITPVMAYQPGNWNTAL